MRKEGEPGNKAVMARDRGKIASFSGSPLHTHTNKKQGRKRTKDRESLVIKYCHMTVDIG